MVQRSTMDRYVALLGGINVGGHRVKMSDLRSLFETMGFDGVETFIASGNVIFGSAVRDTDALERQIEHHLHDALGYKVPTFIRSWEELNAVADFQPFPKLDGNPDSSGRTLSVMFMARALSADEEKAFAAFQTPRVAFHVHRREIYLLCHTKTSESLVDWSRLAKTISMPPVTVRNANTVRRLAEKIRKRGECRAKTGCRLDRICRDGQSPGTSRWDSS